MSIRNQLRRALRKSAASADSGATSTTISSNISQSSETSLTLQKTTSILSRAFTWGGREKDAEFNSNNSSNNNKSNKADKKKRSKRGGRPLHPSEKPLTAQNLKHQEMLSHFTMTFGASDPSQIDRLSFIGISPCCTRRPSLDGDAFTSEEESRHSTINDEDGMAPP